MGLLYLLPGSSMSRKSPRPFRRKCMDRRRDLSFPDVYVELLFPSSYLQVILGKVACLLTDVLSNTN